MSHLRRWIAGLLLGGLLASGAAAQSGSDPAAALNLAISAAESSLQKHDFRAAESRYREALFEGWLLMVTLERLEGRLAEAREALRNVSTFAVDSRAALQSRALAHLQMGDPAPVVELLAGLAAKDAKDVETHRLLSKALAADGHMEQAARELDEASAAVSGDPELAFVLATEYLWLRKVDGAERLFAEILKVRPMPQTHVLIGRAYRDAGEYARARAELHAALLQDPTVRRAHYYLGMVFLAEGGTDAASRLERAKAEFEEELKLAPLDAPTNDQLGVVLLQTGRPAEALPALETAAREEARAAHFYDLARCQLALDRAADAAASSRRALALAQEAGAGEDELERTHYQLGRALRILGAEQEAATHLAEAARLGRKEDSRKGAAAPAEAVAAAVLEASPLSGLSPPQRLELKGRVTTGLVRACFNLGVLQAQNLSITPAAERYARAAEFFARAADLDPAFPQVQSSLGVARFNARQFDRATEPLSRALAANPQDASLKRMLATSWLDIQQWDKAAALLKDDPDRQTDPAVQFAYGLALVRSGRAAEAETVLSGLLARQGDSAELSVLIGQAQAERGKLDAAIESLQRALRLKADVAEAHATLGAVYQKQGRLKEAEAALRAELAARPTDVPSRQTLAAVLDLEKRPDEAVLLLRDVVRTRPESAEARAQLGRILLAQGAAAEAVEQLEAAERLTPEDADVHDQLGRAYQELGRMDLARQQFDASQRLRARR